MTEKEKEKRRRARVMLTELVVKETTDKKGRTRRIYQHAASAVEYDADGTPLLYRDVDGAWHNF